MHREWLETDTEWVVTLWTGEILSIYADMYGVDGDDLVFETLAPGKPLVLVEVARFPQDLIDDLVTEFADRSGDPRVAPVERPQCVVFVPGLPPIEDSILKSDTEWLLELSSGEVLSIYADNTSVDGPDTVFTVSVPEDPRYRVELARVPTALIRSASPEVADRPGAQDRYVERPRMAFGKGTVPRTRPATQGSAPEL